jgi:outer membrane protein OmpA-like peptidoglycan-associated protein
MQAITAKRVFIFVIAAFSMSLMVGCAHLEKAPKDRPGYLYYHKPLPEAARALDEARMAGKDKECPAEFNAAKDMVDKSYEVYMACRTQEAIDMAQEAIGKIKALCPAKPVAEMKPEPKPVPVPLPLAPPPPPPPPALVPVVEPVKIILEDIHFDFDKATLTKVATGILDSNIKTLKENPGANVQIEGHTCAHGAEDYNMALSERRANAVKEYLVNQGIAANRMTTISYGETRLAMPETPTPKNKESKEAKANRRVHFEIIVK